MKTFSKRPKLIFLACIGFGVVAPLNLFAQTKIKIDSPKSNSVVSRIEDFSGTISAQGIPFIFARPIPGKVETQNLTKPKSRLQNETLGTGKIAAKTISAKAVLEEVAKNPWWIQKNCVVDSNGKFSGQVHFGNNLTPDGTKFEVFGVLITNMDHARKLREMYSIETVPRNIGVRSRTMIFELDKNKTSSVPNSFVKYPTNADLVGRHETLVGMIPKYGTPVVFVRAIGEDAWWVQNIIKPDEKGGFKCDLHFGNDNTPSKSKFQIAVAVLEDQVAQNIRRGSTMVKLPRDHLGLQTVTVQLEHEITFRNASNQRKSK